MIKALLRYTSPGDQMIDDKNLYATIDALQSAALMQYEYLG